MIQTTRFIDEIIIHCSATPEGRDITSEAINKAHKARKFTAYTDAERNTRYIGYHYIIHPNGDIENCRPVKIPGCHATGHNNRSIGICYIGGLDRSGSIPKDTRTPAQKQAILSLIKLLKNRYPDIVKVMGHRDTSPDKNGNGRIDTYEYIKACPCFDAIPEYNTTQLQNSTPHEILHN